MNARLNIPTDIQNNAIQVIYCEMYDYTFSRLTLVPWIPRGSWFIFITSLFSKMSLNSCFSVLRSVDIINGAAMIAHMAI